MSRAPVDRATSKRLSNRLRWWFAWQLNRLPNTCWTGLVSWALGDRPLWSRYGDGDIRQDWMCRSGAKQNSTCYCGKIRDGAA